jgi:hypothetical protein
MQTRSSLRPPSTTPLYFGESSEPTPISFINTQHQSLVGYGRLLATCLQQAFQQYWEASPEWVFSSVQTRLKRPYHHLQCYDVELPLERTDETGATVYGQCMVKLPKQLMYLQARHIFGVSSQPDNTTLSGLEAYTLNSFMRRVVEAIAHHVNTTNTLHEEHHAPLTTPFLSEGDWWFTLRATPASIQQVFHTPLQAISENVEAVALIKLPATFIPEVTLEHVALAAPWPQFLAWNESLGSPLASRVNLMAGTTTATIEELKQLEPGDLVVLDHSQLGQLGFSHPDAPAWQAFPFKVNGTLEALEHIDIDPSGTEA